MTNPTMPTIFELPGPAVEMNLKGDPLADSVVKEILDRGLGGFNGEASNLLKAIVQADSPIPDGAPDLLRDYLEQTRTVPDWVEEWWLRDVYDCFKHHKTILSAILSTAGLIGTYLSPMGAYTLHSTHRLDCPHRRLTQSTRIFMQWGEEGSFGPQSKLIPSIQKTRLIHASIRQLHLRRGWNVGVDGMPVSQLYMFAAMVIFSIGSLQSARRLGFRLTDEQEAAFCYAWLVIGEMLGIPHQETRTLLGLPTGTLSQADGTDLVENGRRFFEDELRTKTWAGTDTAVMMTREALDLYRSLMPRGMGPMVPAFARIAVGTPEANWVKIPRNPLYDAMARVMFPLAGRLSSKAGGNRLTSKGVDLLGSALHTTFLSTFTAGQSREQEIPDSLDGPA